MADTPSQNLGLSQLGSSASDTLIPGDTMTMSTPTTKVEMSAREDFDGNFQQPATPYS